jgi:hypothetical protein
MTLVPGMRTYFFQNPVGQGSTLFGSGPKHFGDTNMYLQGQMPAGWTFVVRSLYVEPLDDSWYGTALAGAAIEFIIGAKRFLEIPYQRARCSLVVTPEMMGTAFRMVDELKLVAPQAIPMLLGSMPGISFGFDLEGRNLWISAGEHFNVEVMTPDSAAGKGPVRIYLNGTMGRSVQ